MDKPECEQWEGECKGWQMEAQIILKPFCYDECEEYRPRNLPNPPKRGIPNNE